MAQIDYARMRELPPDARAAIGFEMAEIGEPFQETDLVRDGATLPLRRFVAARQIGCHLQVQYESGGRGYGMDVMDIDFVAGRWRRRQP